MPEPLSSRRRVQRLVWLTLSSLLFLLLAAELGVHAFLNIGLPQLLSARPERLHLHHTGAWMARPGEVHVSGLQIRNQGPRDQWYLEVDRATLRFDIAALWDGEVRITEANGAGGIFWWRQRLDAPGATESATPTDASPPIPGFENPPLWAPEALYSTQANPWRVMLEDVHITEVRELWIGDHRFEGDAVVSGSLEVQARAWLEARSVVLTVASGAVSRADSPVLTDVRGEARMDYAGTAPGETPGELQARAISGTVVLDANTRDLRFLDFYLRKVPWLRLARGRGALRADIVVEEGKFVDSSRASATVTDFVARMLSYTVTGTGELLFEVEAHDGDVQTRMKLELVDYVVKMAPKSPPHLQGQGLVVTATTPDVAIDMPFDSLEVRIQVPEAKILDVASYNAYLPNGAGVSLGSGTGTVRAHLTASTTQGDCSAEVFLEGQDVNLDLDQVAMVGNVSLHGIVPSGNLIRGVYEVSGSTLELRGLQVRSGSSDNPDRDESDGWWGRATVTSGQVAEGAPTFLKGTVVLTARDTVPLVTLFAERHTVPGWLRGLLTTGPVSGSAQVSMGQNLLRLSRLDLSAGNFQVLAEIRRRDHTAGKLHVQFGTLSLAVGLSRPANKVYLINSRRWYEAEPDPS